jgi:hypothetical protein
MLLASYEQLSPDSTIQLPHPCTAFVQALLVQVTDLNLPLPKPGLLHQSLEAGIESSYGF